MEIRQLEYFCTLAHLENFTRTAEALHVSQPSVTKAIKSLESEIGLMLVDRRQKRVSLTMEGRAFLLHAEEIMQAVERAEQDMLRFRPDAKRTVHFGLPPMLEAYLFPDFFTKFTAAHPDINLDVCEYVDSVEVRAKVEEGLLDFGVVLAPAVKTHRNEMAVLKDKMELCLPLDHPLTAREHVAVADLRREKFIMQQPNTYQYDTVYRSCVENGFTPEILLCTSQLKTIKQLVANSLGISILPDFVTRSETIFARRPLVPEMEIQVNLFWSPQKRLSETGRKVVSFMEEYTMTDEFRERFRQ